MASLSAVCEEAMSRVGVVGVACVDRHGLCLHQAGSVPENVCGSIAELSASAQLVGGSGAVVNVTNAELRVMLSQSDGVTTAVFMKQA